jgi:hypothetical protein
MDEKIPCILVTNPPVPVAKNMDEEVKRHCNWLAELDRYILSKEK